MLNIFIAEDSPADIVLVRQALAQHGIQHELHVAKDGEKAIHFVSQMGKPGYAPCPDLILLDLNLPKADGPQVLSEFRQHPECADTPVIIVTSSDAPRDRASVSQFGVNRYFLKPVHLDAFMQLGAVVRDVLGTKQASSS